VDDFVRDALRALRAEEHGPADLVHPLLAHLDRAAEPGKTIAKGCEYRIARRSRLHRTGGRDYFVCEHAHEVADQAGEEADVGSEIIREALHRFLDVA